MIGGEEALSVDKINVVLVIKYVWSADVVDGGVGGVGGGAGEFEVLGEGLVHVGVLVWVEAVGEGGAVSDADGVAAGEGDEVGGVEAEVAESADEEAHVGGRRREVSVCDVGRREGEAVSPA